jgi:hypothetical protein
MLPGERLGCFGLFSRYVIRSGRNDSMARETFIENNVIRNRERVLGIRDSLFLRRSALGRGFGVADLVILPARGRHRLVIVEAKQATSPDAKIKVLGQLLMYYAGALEFGARGLRLMRQYAALHPREARSRRRKSLKALSGGLTPPDEAWAELRKGRKIRPEQIALYAALDSKPGPALTSALSAMSRHHGLDVGVISVLGKDNLTIWRPG